MCIEPLKSVVGDRCEKPARRASRILSARTAARREQLRSQLVEPGVVAEDVGLLTDQANGIYLAFKPRNDWQDWLTSTIATTMVRINRCERIERKLRDLASYRAIDFWEDDQVVEVETLACKIDRDPALVVAKLRQTPRGLDWLLKRWRFLAKIDPQSWTDDQRKLAARLVGGDPEVDPTAEGFAAETVIDLENLQKQVAETDAIIRGLVEADLSDEHVPGLAKLRRYARSLHRQMKWFVDQFHVEHPDRWDDPRRKPAFEVANGQASDSRTPTWNFADSKSQNDKTKPFAAGSSEPESDKTKPTCVSSKKEIDKTNPIGRVELTAKLAEAIPQVVPASKVVVGKSSRETDNPARRERRSDRVQEVARRQKAARRREALGYGSPF